MSARDTNAELVEVAFEIPPAENLGYPVEWVWAEVLGSGQFRLRNQPVYASGYAYGDVVDAAETQTGMTVTSAAARSGTTAIRVHAYDDQAKTNDVKTALEELGASTSNTLTTMLFVAIFAPDVPLGPVLDWLEGEVERVGEDNFDFEPLFVSQEHAREARGEREWLDFYL